MLGPNLAGHLGHVEMMKIEQAGDEIGTKFEVVVRSMYPSGEAPLFRDRCRGPRGCAGQRHWSSEALVLVIQRGRAGGRNAAIVYSL